MKKNIELFPCYIHIEKCAGTTLHHSIKYNLPGYLTLNPWYYWSNDPNNYLKKEELKWIKRFFPFLQGIGGHTTRSYANYEKVIDKEIKYFTFVRNPIDRYLSHYNHQVNKMGIGWSIEKYIHEKRFNNYITTRIAGKEDLDLAIRRVREQFTFIGLFESFNESILLLNQLIFLNKIPPFYEFKNDSKKEKKLKFEDLSDTQKSIVIHNNRLDTKLYNYIFSKEYPEYKKLYLGNLEDDKVAFNAQNKNFKYNKLRYSLIKATRLYSEKIVENIAHKFSKS